MQITREPHANHTILAYDNAQLTIDHINYQQSLIISQEKIISDWPVQNIQALTEKTLVPILECNPEIIIIGHNNIGAQISITLLEKLSKLRIGIECMNIGAASRTFNVLLSEQRAVVAGIIISC